MLPIVGNPLVGDYTFHLSTATVSLGAMSTTLADNIGADNTLFFSGSLGTGSLAFTVVGTPFYYDPALGDLLLDIVVNNQDDVPNDGNNGYNDASGPGPTQTSFALGNTVIHREAGDGCPPGVARACHARPGWTKPGGAARAAPRTDTAARRSRCAVHRSLRRPNRGCQEH
ncbi:MAG: hypothetical protein IPG06_05970 [Haliea sp.]|nr:hypothetical protein [Haliea sp.]